MIYSTLILPLALSFNISNSNLTSYERHATFQSATVSLSSTSTSYLTYDSYYANCYVTYYGDLWFNEPSNNNYEWAYSISSVDLTIVVYHLDEDLFDYEQIDLISSSINIPNYSLNNPSSNIIFLDSNNNGYTGSFYSRFYLGYSNDDSVNYELYYGNSLDIITYSYELDVEYDNQFNIGGQHQFLLSYANKDIAYFIDSYYATGGSFEQGYSSGYDYGWQQGNSEGYSNGFNDGFNAALESNSTALTIFNGILNIALVPINFFLGIFNFTILGINLSEFVGALLSICCIIIVLRVVFQGGSKGGES